jgi:hypothetical protein
MYISTFHAHHYQTDSMAVNAFLFCSLPLF